ncbi:hypothetical protein BDV11DRAFT_195672 [Aspergillus similis]
MLNAIQSMFRSVVLCCALLCPAGFMGVHTARRGSTPFWSGGWRLFPRRRMSRCH